METGVHIPIHTPGNAIFLRPGRFSLPVAIGVASDAPSWDLTVRRGGFVETSHSQHKASGCARFFSGRRRVAEVSETARPQRFVENSDQTSSL